MSSCRKGMAPPLVRVRPAPICTVPDKSTTLIGPPAVRVRLNFQRPGFQSSDPVRNDGDAAKRHGGAGIEVDVPAAR